MVGSLRYDILRPSKEILSDITPTSLSSHFGSDIWLAFTKNKSNAICGPTFRDYEYIYTFCYVFVLFSVCFWTKNSEVFVVETIHHSIATSSIHNLGAIYGTFTSFPRRLSTILVLDRNTSAILFLLYVLQFL